MSDHLIRERAYAIWEAEGRPHGCEKQHWQRAESELTAAKPKRQRKPRAAKPIARTKKTTLKVVAG